MRFRFASSSPSLFLILKTGRYKKLAERPQMSFILIFMIFARHYNSYWIYIH